jgi:hypothetical protein
LVAARIIAGVVSERPTAFVVGVQNSAPAGKPLPVPRTLQPVDLFFSVAIADSDGKELYRSPRAKAKLKLKPGAEDSYIFLEPGDALSTSLAVDPSDLKLKHGAYAVSVTYHPGAFTGPGGKGAPGELSATFSFSIG